MTKQDTIAIYENPSQNITINDLASRVRLIHEAMKSVMDEGTDFGIIEGSKKPTLLKPGAEKLTQLFNIRPRFNTEIKYLENEHILAISKCELYHQKTGEFWGSADAICSSLEKKYKYRTEYKNGKKQKVDNPDIPDLYNTIIKMAEKRSFVGATLFSTASSGLFTQDVEDLDNGLVVEVKPIQKTATEIENENKLKEIAMKNYNNMINSFVEADIDPEKDFPAEFEKLKKLKEYKNWDRFIKGCNYLKDLLNNKINQKPEATSIPETTHIEDKQPIPATPATTSKEKFDYIKYLDDELTKLANHLNIENIKSFKEDQKAVIDKIHSDAKLPYSTEKHIRESIDKTIELIENTYNLGD